VRKLSVHYYIIPGCAENNESEMKQLSFGQIIKYFWTPSGRLGKDDQFLSNGS